MPEPYENISCYLFRDEVAFACPSDGFYLDYNEAMSLAVYLMAACFHLKNRQPGSDSFPLHEGHARVTWGEAKR